MNEQIDPLETQLARQETLIGQPARTDKAGIDAPVSKRARKKLITTIALTIDTCRWPVGNPVDPDFHYCGELPLIGRPYCDKHDARSYQAARKKNTAV